jgi:hypothetical protein
LEKRTLQNLHADILSGDYNYFMDRFVWMLTFKDNNEEITYSGNVAGIT